MKYNIIIILTLIFLSCSGHSVKSYQHFSPATRIVYNLRHDQNISLVTYDVNGNPIDTLVNQLQKSGSYELTPNLSSYKSGVYFYRLVTEDTSYTKRIMLLK
jgi:hypothetical protein